MRCWSDIPRWMEWGDLTFEIQEPGTMIRVGSLMALYRLCFCSNEANIFSDMVTRSVVFLEALSSIRSMFRSSIMITLVLFEQTVHKDSIL